jgi:hypothetical protein
MKIAPGVRLNFSKSTMGLSFGVPGARISVNTRGDVYTSAGIPGTGLYSVERSSLRARKGRRKKPEPGEFVEQIPAPSFFAARNKKALFRALKKDGKEALEEVRTQFPEIAYICDALIFPRLIMGTSTDAKDHFSIRDSLALSVLMVTWIYNEFFWAIVLIKSDKLRPITSALGRLQGEFRTDFNLLAAGAIMAALPTLIIFFILKRQFVSGLTLGSTKG